MTQTLRLTAAQAMVKWLCVQMTEDGDRFLEGVWAIFGHGNVTGLGEALQAVQAEFPTWRGQNELPTERGQERRGVAVWTGGE